MELRDLINDFVHSRGYFSDTAIDNYVDARDLQSVRYHFGAGSNFLEQAKAETLESEWRRLMELVEWHFQRADSILRKYDC